MSNIGRTQAARLESSTSPPRQQTPLRIAAAADWGTGTLEAETVAKNMEACAPHYALHLGDVYYMGEAVEIRENCLGTPTKNFAGVRWPTGSLGSFALMGTMKCIQEVMAISKHF
jgi:hypothetical protein